MMTEEQHTVNDELTGTSAVPETENLGETAGEAAAPAGEQPQGTPQEPKAKGKKGRWVGSVIRGDVLQSKGMLRQIPLILLLCVFGIALVYNRYRIEDLSRKKQEKQNEFNYLNQKRIELQKRYQETVKISEIAEMLDSTGIGITAGPPYELIIDR